MLIQGGEYLNGFPKPGAMALLNAPCHKKGPARRDMEVKSQKEHRLILILMNGFKMEPEFIGRHIQPPQ